MPWHRGVLLVLALALAGLWGCVSMFERVAVPLIPGGARGPAGVLDEPGVEGPELWVGGPGGATALATGPQGLRVAATDGLRVGIWDAVERRLIQALPPSGWQVRGAAWSPSGALLAVEEEASAQEEGVARLRIVALEAGRTLGWAELPCGCLVDYAFSQDGLVLRAVLSSEALGGTWVLGWATSGELLETVALGPEVVDGDGVARLLEDAATVAWLEGPRQGSATQRLRLLDAATGLARVDRPVEAPAALLGCARTDRTCHQTLALADGRLLVAAGDGERPSRLASFDAADGELLMEDRVGVGVPLLWLPGARPRLLQDDPEGPSQWRVVPWGGAASEAAEAGLGVPAPPLVRLRRGWVANRLARPFEALFALPQRADPPPRWLYGQSSLGVDLDSGVVWAGSWHADWRWSPEEAPAPLPGLDLQRSRGWFLGPPVRAGGPPTQVIVRSSRVEIIEPDGVEPGRVLGEAPSARMRPVAEWLPEQGRVAQAQRWGQGVLVLVREAHDRARLVQLDAWGRPVGQEVMDLPPHSTRWHLWLDAQGKTGAVLSMRRHSAQDSSLFVRRFEAMSLRALPVEEVRLDRWPRALEVTRGAALALMPSRHEVAFVSLADPALRLRSWSAPPEDWLKGVLSLGDGRLAVRLTRQEFPAAERWLALDMSVEPPRVLGHRRLSRVVAAATDPGRGLLHLLEGRGVLTTLRLEPGGLVPVRAAWLDSQGEAFVAIDGAGRVAVPEHGAALAWTLGALDQGVLAAGVLGREGFVRPGRLIR